MLQDTSTTVSPSGYPLALSCVEDVKEDSPSAVTGLKKLRRMTWLAEQTCILSTDRPVCVDPVGPARLRSQP